MKSVKDEGIVTQLAVVATMMPKVKEYIDQQADRIAELEKQTKPLSNEEILEMTIWNKNLYELYVEMEKEDMIAFARAIEERHGIK